MELAQWRRSPTSAIRAAAAVAMLGATGACFSMLPSSGGGDAGFEPPRRFDATDVALEAGYEIELVASGLTFPTGVTFDAENRPCVVESGYCPGEAWTEPRLLRIDSAGADAAGWTVLALGARDAGPWNGVAYHDGVGAFFIAEGGHANGGRILRVDADGTTTAIVEDLPSAGDHHTNGPVIDPSGAVVFGQGTVTNSGVVGEDSALMGWLKRHPDAHDVPARDVVLTGVNFETADLLADHGDATTGAFLPFGTPSTPGQVIEGKVPGNGGIFKVAPGGGEVGLVAWGLRNPYALAYDAGGRLHAIDNGYDQRGSRPVFGSGEPLYAIEDGAWYGWPDYDCGERIDSPRYGEGGSPRPQALLRDPPGEPPQPLLVLPVHASADGIDFSRSEAFGHVGDAFIAEFGDQSPATGKVRGPIGFKIVRADLDRCVTSDFAVNRGKVNGPASRLESGGLERPVALRFDRTGESLYVVDFGVVTERGGTTRPYEGTGALWRIRFAGHAPEQEGRP